MFSTNTEAFDANKQIVNGDSENLSKIIYAISVYTPLLEEKTEKIAEEKNYTFLDKPEIVNTKTREEIEKEKTEKEKELKKEQLAQSKRNVVARDRVLPSEENDKEIISTPRNGNGYFYGFCTWYVANRRLDIPNNWGNAKSWLGSAQSAGWETGSNASPGAIIVTKESWAGHVGYVENVDETTITISEMNFTGWGRTNTRTINKNNPIIRGFIY